MTLDQILTQYADSLIIQYRNKTKARATIKVLANCSVCDGLAQAERDCWLLDSASGAQLTVLGKIVGVSRNVVGLDLEHTFFSFTDYFDTPESIGFASYSDNPYPEDLFLDYRNFSIYTLTDFELRELIKLKIIYNMEFSSMKYLTESLYAYFGTDISVSDNGLIRDVTEATFFNFTNYSGTPESIGFANYTDSPYPSDLWDSYSYHYLMTLSYQVKSVYRKAFEAGIFLDVIPRPMGVATVVNYVN